MWTLEGCWVRYDYKSTHAYCIYWPGKNSISVEQNIRFVPTSVSLYSLAIDLPVICPQPAITQVPQAPSLPPLPSLPSLPSRQQSSIILPASVTSPSHASSPEALSKVSPFSAKPYPYATKSGEEEMPEQEDTVLATPASSPSLQLTLLWMPTTPSKGKLPVQPPATPRKAKDSPAYQLPTHQSIQITEQTKCTQSAESSASAPTHKRRMPRGLGTPTGGGKDIADIALSVEDLLSSPSDTDDLLQLTEHQELCYMVAIAIQEVQGNPKTLREACSCSDWPQWQEAMDCKMAILEGAKTWEVVSRPLGRNIVGSKWVFCIKRNVEGKIQKYKARLVACRFTQILGQDYYDTFSPVARLASFRAVLVLATHHDWEIDMFDFIGTYLNSTLDDDEEIYMQPPPGYEG